METIAHSTYLIGHPTIKKKVSGKFEADEFGLEFKYGMGKKALFPWVNIISIKNITHNEYSALGATLGYAMLGIFGALLTSKVNIKVFIITYIDDKRLTNNVIFEAGNVPKTINKMNQLRYKYHR